MSDIRIAITRESKRMQIYRPVFKIHIKLDAFATISVDQRSTVAMRVRHLVQVLVRRLAR